MNKFKDYTDGIDALEYCLGGKLETLIRKGLLYEKLSEELGCPLEVVFKVLKGEKILCENEEYYGSLRWNFYTEGFVFDLNTNKEITNFYLRTNDYGKTWWLKGEKDETKETN